MRKKCTKCNKRKLLTEFSFRNKGKNTRHAACKDCYKRNAKEHYQNNRASYIRKAKVARNKMVEANRTKIFDYLTSHPCVDCGENDPIVLQFDHVRGEKKNAVSIMIGGGYSWESLQVEINKCEMRCANCHARKTAKQLGYWHPIFKLPSSSG